MKTFLAVLVLILAVIGYGQAVREREEKGGRTSVKIMGQSGKIRVSTPRRTAVVIDFDEMKERNSSNEVVGKSGKRKHSFNSFAKQEFNFSKVVKYEYNGLKTKHFNFTAMIEGTGATLNVEVYVFMEEGEFVYGSETLAVKNGTVKFNIELRNWEFCNGSSNCKSSEFGEFVDLTIAISSKSKPRKKTGPSPSPRPGGGKRPQEEFELGDEALLSLSSQIDVDGTLTNMAGGYPMHESKGSKELFTFRFPKFNDRVLYDPSVTINDEDSNSALNLGASSVVLFMGALIAAILAH